MTHKTPPTPISHNLENLKETLTHTMLVNGHDPAILAQQVEILDRLFTAVIDSEITPRIGHSHISHEVAKDWLKLALQVQKQCSDTVKSRAAIEYMERLSAIHTAPHPRKTIKRTCETEKT